jgi:hypothetical protein
LAIAHSKAPLSNLQLAAEWAAWGTGAVAAKCGAAIGSHFLGSFGKPEAARPFADAKVADVIRVPVQDASCSRDKPNRSFTIYIEPHELFGSMFTV